MVIKENESQFQHRHCECNEAICLPLAESLQIATPSARNDEATGGLVPRLRFPEFRDASPWEEKRLGDVFSVSAGGDIDKSRFSKEKSQIYPYPVFANSKENNGLYGYASYYKEEKDCITITGRGDVGTVNARHERFVPIVRLLVLRPNFESDIDFLEANLSRLDLCNESTGVPQLTAPKISSYKIPIPPHPDEQRKIADFLTAVDAKISALQQKRTLLADYKKGLMQQLFPTPSVIASAFPVIASATKQSAQNFSRHCERSEAICSSLAEEIATSQSLLAMTETPSARNDEARGGIVPRLRFPDFRDAPPWEEKRLGDVGTVVTGKTPVTTNESLWNGNIQFITPTDIDKDTKYLYKTERTVQNIGNIKILPKNTICYTCIASLGKMCLTTVDAITNQQINALIPTYTESTEFIFYKIQFITPSILATQSKRIQRKSVVFGKIMA